METYNFFAMLSRMKYINRWGLMRNTRDENISEHSLETAIIAHAIAITGNKFYDRNYDTDRVAVLALYHDVSEILTGDMPTPVKYHSKKIIDAYKEVEKTANEKLLSLLPDYLYDDYKPLLSMENEDPELKKIVKAADKISALIKCIEETKSGNSEFLTAEKTIRKTIDDMNLAEVDYFVEKFIPPYKYTLDELNML